MNAPETHITEPINAAHAVLMRATEALCAQQVAKDAAVAKATATKQIKELSDLGLLEMEIRKGGTPFYFLTTPVAPITEREPERVLTPEGQAERDEFEREYGPYGNCACHINPPCGSCTHPGNPRNQEEDDSCWLTVAPTEMQATSTQMQVTPGEMQVTSIDWTAPEMQYLAPEDYKLPPADPEFLALANRELGKLLRAVTAERDELAEVERIWETNMMQAIGEDGVFSVAKAIQVLRNERDDLRARLDALTEQWEADTGRLTADLRAAIEAKSHAINEADRLRAQLAGKERTHQMLMERNGASALLDAVGYIVRAAKRKPRTIMDQGKAREAALSAIRAGAQRAEVFALLPVGVARKGAEWRAKA